MSTKLANDPYDGTLASWSEIRSKADWDAIVLGNGMSINLWGNFTYESLYEEAKETGLLSDADRALFEELGTENFEEVLHMLSDAILVGDAIREDRPTERALHESIQKGLARAVQKVHITGGEVPEETLQAIRAELRHYRHAFTTSYDLLTYWAAAKGEYGFDGIPRRGRYGGSRGEGDVRGEPAPPAAPARPLPGGPRRRVQSPPDGDQPA